MNNLLRLDKSIRVTCFDLFLFNLLGFGALLTIILVIKTFH